MFGAKFLNQFGDTTQFSLLGVLIVLPSVLVLAERQRLLARIRAARPRRQQAERGAPIA